LEVRALLSFAAPFVYNLSSNPSGVAVADFNRDGKPDLVGVTNSGSVQVLLGNGDGSFQSPIRSPAGSTAYALAVGEFDGDGIPNLVVTNTTFGLHNEIGGTTVSVLLGNGDGTFQSPVAYTVGTGPVAVAVGDFLGNGRQDIVTANDSGTVSVLLGNGDGSFQSAVNVPVGAHLHSVALADFNGDGKQDLVIGGLGGVGVLLGNGDGSFQAPVNYSVGSHALSVTVADLASDGKLDLVATDTNYYQGSVSVLLGNGDGSFQNAHYLSTGKGSPTVPAIVGDFNGDGKLDLIVSTFVNFSEREQVNVLQGNGDGTFQSAVNTGLPSVALAAADFTGGGNLDLLIEPGAVVRGHGDGTFTNTPSYAVGYGPNSVAVGDFTASGKQDMVIAGASGTVTVLLNNGDGTFRSGPTLSGSNYSTSVVVGDFNGDSKEDIAVAGSTPDGAVLVYQGNGDGTFQAPLTFDLGFNTSTDQLVVGDFNGDGRPDLAVTYGQYPNNEFVKVLLNNGDGTFTASGTYQVGHWLFDLTVGDFNGDGKQDLVVAGSSLDPGVRVLLGNGDGTFQDPVAVPGTSNLGPAVAVGDFNGDGKADLVLPGLGAVNILLGNGDGTFQSPIAYPLDANLDGYVAVGVGDFFGDGKLGIAVVSTYSHSVSVLRGNGDATFQGAVNYLVGYNGSQPTSLAVGNFTGHGMIDLAVTNWDTASVSVLLNQNDGMGLGQGVGPRPSQSAAARDHSPRLEITPLPIAELIPLPAPPVPETTGVTAVMRPLVRIMPTSDAFFAALEAEKSETPFAPLGRLDANAVEAWRWEEESVDELGALGAWPGSGHF
jgi:hypothetical protein